MQMTKTNLHSGILMEGYSLFTNVGENLAESTWSRPIAPAVVSEWEISPEHLTNLLGPFRVCGIGVSTDSSGTTFVVQLLAGCRRSERSQLSF